MKIISNSFTLFFVSITVVQAIPAPAPALVDSSLNAFKSMRPRQLEQELKLANMIARESEFESSTALATIDEVNALWNRHHKAIPNALGPKLVSFRQS